MHSDKRGGGKVGRKAGRHAGEEGTKENTTYYHTLHACKHLLFYWQDILLCKPSYNTTYYAFLCNHKWAIGRSKSDYASHELLEFLKPLYMCICNLIEDSLGARLYKEDIYFEFLQPEASV